MASPWFTPPDIDRKPIRLPEGFRPKHQHREMAAHFGIDLEQAFATFCDHHAAKGNKFLNWDRALSTWLRREKQFSRQRPNDSHFVFKTLEHTPCPIGFCDGGGWYVDSRTRRVVDCECASRIA